MTNVNPYRTFFETEGHNLGRKRLDLSDLFPENSDFRNYMIIIAGRCGSTWLGRMLQDLGFVGTPNEWFNTQGLPAYYAKRNARGLADYVKQTAKLHPVFGVQINPERLFHLEELIDFDKTFAGFATIDLRRRDFVAQAFSFARAHRSGRWHNVQGPPSEVEDQDVWKMIRYIIRNEQRIDKWYGSRKLSPLRLNYEDILTNPDAVILRILLRLSRKNELPFYSPLPQPQKRNGDGSTDTAYLDFLGRYIDRIEAIHTDRSRANGPKFIRRR
ncbi:MULTISPECIES: Stf0 family sulfotransferase [Hyphomonas]|uniref:Sulphotransferase Stf0 domain-containing protein n=1 Tax=Hyphomonas adhaerens TaxID=81029 RepID=A0A3B9H4K8_9PROT|nr:MULTISPECIES: Stf0 family sulfotransferase [Hyphomonas]MBB42098.1 hypothetical protein [Hyphomonas sp.]HAE29184.1 hypothetical protein [Hyphomonas adhaerens]|tara:strand:- start:478 stop:1293 length:816 start_codon:yes stop_codon:yes gene_type:complete